MQRLLPSNLCAPSSSITIASDEEEEEEDLDDSDVVRYALAQAERAAAFSSQEVEALKQSSPKSLFLLHGEDEPLYSDDLAACYSLSFSSSPSHPVLLAAGKGGVVTMFNDPFRKPKERPAPYSFVAHSRWIGTARLADPALFSEGTFPVLTASDDSLVKLWDLSKVGKTKPRLLWSSNQVHDRGIFAMEVRRNCVVTGSKDKTVALSYLDPAGGALKSSSRFSLHAGVVKGVDLKEDGQVLASAGQDRCICVKDSRVHGDSAVIEIEECHHGGRTPSSSTPTAKITSC